MKKTTLMAFLLALLAPIMSAWANDFNYSAAVNVSPEGTGSGTVYVGKATTTSTETLGTKSKDVEGAVAGTSGSNGKDVTCKFTITATPDENSIFSGWTLTGNGTIADVTKNETTVTLIATKSTLENPAANVTATFISTLPIDVECAKPNHGSYTINATSVADADRTVTVAYPYSVTVSAIAESNFKLSGWWAEDADGNITTFPATETNVTLPGGTKKFGADFAPEGVAIYAFKSGTIYTADRLADALAAAQEGESIVVYENVTLNHDATVPVGVFLTISEGVTVTVDTGCCLTLAGNIENNGQITGSGSVALNYKTITQESTINVPFPYGTDGVESGNGVDGTDGTSGKYVKTRIEQGVALTGCSCTKKWFVKVKNGDGSYMMTTNLLSGSTPPKAVKCVVNRKTALNWISGVVLAYTDFEKALTDSYYPVGSGSDTDFGVVKDNEYIVVMLESCTDVYKSSYSSTSAPARYAIDCAENTLSFYPKQFGSHGLARFFNGNVTIASSNSKVMRPHLNFYGCSTVSVSGLAIASYSTSVALYNSPNVTKMGFVDSSTKGGARLSYYGGSKYDTGKFSSVSGVTKVYWGSFSSDPTNYLADKNRYKATKISTTQWDVERHSGSAAHPFKIGDTETDTLDEAISFAKVSGDVIVQQKDFTIDTQVVVPADADVTLDLSGWNISGNGSIVNRGNLDIVDYSGCVVASILSVPILCEGGNTYLSGATFENMITAGPGKCWFLDGVFNGGITVAGANDEVTEEAQIVSGTFVANTYMKDNEVHSLYDLCPSGRIVGNTGSYRLATIPRAYLTGTSTYTIKAFDPNTTDGTLYSKSISSTKKTNYSSRAEWIRAIELHAQATTFASWGIDCTMVFDREVSAGSISATTAGNNITLDSKVGANDIKSVLLPKLREISQAGSTQWGSFGPWTYTSFLPGGEHANQISMSVNNDKTDNEGTVCWLQMRLASNIKWQSGPKDWSYDIANGSVVIAETRMVFGAGNSIAMIRPASGAATFYPTLALALNSVVNNGTVMLANDCAEVVTVGKECTIMVNGFNFTGSVTAADGYQVAFADGVYVVTKVSAATAVDVPTAVSGLVYDGTEKTGVAAGTGYTLSGNTATASGSYTATATLEEGYVWSDDSSEAKEISWSIGKASLTATAENKSVIRGETVPYTITYSGFVNGEDVSALTAAPTASCDYVPSDFSATATSYTISLSGGSAANYELAFVSGTLTVTPSEASIGQGGDATYVTSISEVVSAAEAGTAVSVTLVTSEPVTVDGMSAGKTLTVTPADGVTANVTVTPAEGAFIETSAVEGGTKYESKKITVEMATPQTTVEVKKIDHGTESAVTDATEINAAVTQLMGNNDVSRTDNTDKLVVLDKITVTPTKIVEEVVESKTIIRSATFDVVPALNAGQSLGEGQTLKFRLPVDAAATQLSAIVYHGTAQFGAFAVQTYNNEKFVEVESADFSPYGYDLLDGETANPVAAIGTTGYATFAEAIEAANAANVDEITILNGATESPDADWKVSDGKLVRKVYVAQIVRNDEVVDKYESLASALEAAQSGDTVQLLANVEGVTETFELHGKNITIDGQGSYSITAGANTEPRSVVQSYGGARNMFVVLSGNVTFKGITLDGGDTHYYTFLVQAKNGTTTFDNVSLLHGGEADSSGTAGVGYGAAVQVDGATVLVTNSFYACTGTNVNDVTTGVFPFTALLYQSGGIHFDDGVAAGIGDDLLLVGMVGAVDVSTDEGRAQVNEMLGTMNVPAGYYPYTLKLGDSEMTSFTGASPLGWNGIIDYGKEIMVSANTSMGMDMNPATTPVEVGLLTDTLLPEVFTFEDANLTVNGNGNALAGTIEYTDNAGLIEDIVLGTEDNPLVLDMTGLGEGNAIHLGSDVSATSVIIKVTEGQATSLGHAIVTWDAAHETEEEAASLETGIVVEIVDAHGEPILDPETNKPKEASVIWDLELGLAYIGPCEARLTGPTHDAPIYTTLADAIARAAQTGDTVTLLMDIANVSGTYEIDKSITLDGAGYKVTAAPVTTHRDVVNAWAGSTTMFKLKTGDITFRNITLDGDATHAYTYLVSADNSSAKLTTENITLLHGGEIAGDANGAALQDGAGYGAAIHLNNGAALTVKDGFYADTHGAPAEAGQTVDKSDGVFPFTGILPEGGSSVLFDLKDDSNEHPTVAIGEDLLLVGMVGVIPHDEVQGILDYMKVPSRFIPYTLTLSDGSAYAFTGASPLGWNDIIDYGKEIMDVSTAIGYQGLDKDTTPVEVGLLTDTALPETFTFADTNFTVNGNGHALSGTIKYTDTAGSVRNIALGSEAAALVVDLSDVTNLPVTLGSGVDVANVVVNLTGEQASFGTAVFKWDAESEDGAPQHEQVVIKVAGNDSDKELVWDDEIGVAYIGPCEARLTGPGREPGYMDLTNAFDMAVGGDTVTLFWSNVTLNASLNLPAGTLLFATNKYELALGEDAALVFTNATTVFRSEMDLLDVIALAGDCANGYWLRHEADGTTNVYSVVERGEYIVTGNTEDGGVGTAVIKVSDEWIAANIGANVRTVNEIDAYLNSTNSTTNLREWEMYVLNQATPFRVTAVGKADNAVSTTLVAPASSETTGFTVAYSLDETLADGSVKTPGTRQASRDFAVPVASVTTHAFYRVRAHLTSGESTLVVDSANTIGVLKATASTAQTIVAVPWAAFGGEDIAVADLLRTDGLSVDDELFVYNPSTQNFRAWTLGSGKTWEPTTVIAAGTNATPGDDASSVTVARGSGVLLKRGSVSAPLCFVGEVASGGKTALGAAQTSGTDGAQSWNLVASPSVEALDIANFPAPSSGGWDRIIVLTSGAPLNLTYKNGKWGYNKVEVKNGMAVPTRVTEGVSIPAGVGFWYLNSGAAREIEW